jgi:hypothetical protein
MEQHSKRFLTISEWFNLIRLRITQPWNYGRMVWF